MSDRLLVPYDDSPPARRALEYAFETYDDPDVTALYVVPIPEGYWSAFEAAQEREPDAEVGRERAREILAGATEVAANADREIETETDSGEPDHRIVDHAKGGDYDTVVIGSHGREGISRILLGSVAEKVVRRSPTPVVVVR